MLVHSVMHTLCISIGPVCKHYLSSQEMVAVVQHAGMSGKHTLRTQEQEGTVNNYKVCTQLDSNSAFVEC